MKLVRDLIPELHARGELGPHPQGHRARRVFRRASHEEYRLLLLVKLAEEVGEVVSAMTREHLLEELGDLRQVIDAIEALEGMTGQEIRRRKEKSARYGGFAEGWVLEWKETET